MLEARLLGQFDVRLDGEPVEIASRLAQSFLAYLMLNAGVGHRREKLAGLLWPEVPDEVARRNLRQALHLLRKAIEPEGEGSFILADEISVSFNRTAPYLLDVSGLERGSVVESSIDDLADAARAYRGELLPGFYDEWVILERERLEVAFDRKMQVLLDRLIDVRRWPETVEWAEHWIARGHTPEPAYRAQMIAYWGMGNQSGVGATYRRCAETLARELGVMPSEQTAALYGRLARGLPPDGAEDLDPGERLAPAAPVRDQPAMRASERLPPAPGESPFKGLQFFGEDDARLFFGREELAAQLVGLVDRWQAGSGPDGEGGGNVVIVVGASGSGKSSLIRAGLVPALRGRAPFGPHSEPGDGAAALPIFLLTPTGHPLEALATCLVGPPRRSAQWRGLVDRLTQDSMTLATSLERMGAVEPQCPVLIVDHLEELFTLCRSETERRAFLENILSAAHSGFARVVLALRADFYGHCGEYPRLRDALTCCQVYVGPMSASELRRAIEQPAISNGWSFEPGLVDLIVRDAGGGPGALPLLSHALLELWNRRSHRTLTLVGYAEAHGVRGAIAKTADTVYHHSLTPEQQALARSIFLRLTELGEGTEDTRRRASFDELVAQSRDRADVDEVLDILTDARLITVSEGTVEVAHEALIREWATLRGWLDEDREGLKQHRHLTEAALAWEGLQRDPGELYRGARLIQALEWCGDHRERLNALEQAFLDASVESANREATERETQRQREQESGRRLLEAEAQRVLAQQRAGRRLRLLAAGLAALLLLALALGGYAWRQQQRVQQQAQVTVSRNLASSAMGSLRADPQRSILLALQAESTADTIEAQQALHSAVLASRAARVVPFQLQPLADSAFSPDGSMFGLTGTMEGGRPTTEIYNVDTGRRLLELPGMLAASTWPDAGWLVTLAPEGDGATRFTYWEIPSGRQISTTLAAYSMRQARTALSPDLKRAAVLAENGAVDLWDAGRGKELNALLRTGSEPVSGAAFSPDGNRLLVYESKRMRMLDLPKGRPQFTATVEYLNHAIVAPGGKQFAVADLGSVWIYDAATGTRLISLPKGQTAYTLHLAYSQDGARLATAASDGTVKVWDAKSGKELLNLPGHGGGVVSLAFNPSGDCLATVGLDQTVRFWDVSAAGGHEWWTFHEPAGSAFTALAISPDGSWMAATSARGTLRVWDLPQGVLVFAAQDDAGPQGAVAFSPDGRLIASTGWQNTVQIREVPSGRLLLSDQDDEDLIGGLAFRPDGREVATVDYAHRIRVWHVESGKLHWAWSGGSIDTLDPAHKLGVAYSPDGSRIAMTGGKTVPVWDADTGRELLQLPKQEALVNAVAFDLTGKRLAAGMGDGEAGIWDATMGNQLLVLPGHTGSIEAVAFSRDGRLLATASADNTVKIWDAFAGVALLTLPGHTAELTGVAFTPDGSRLVTASRDGTLRVYALRSDELASLARSRLVRWWTEAECKKYLPGGICPPER